MDFSEQISRNTSPKDSFSVVISTNGSHIKTRFNPTLALKKDGTYEVALMNLETYYSFPNITKKNNVLVLEKNSTRKKEILNIPIGVYELSEINTYIKKELVRRGVTSKDTDVITFEPNVNTLKTLMGVARDFSVIFDEANSLNSVFGFNKDTYAGEGVDSKYESENLVNIMSINSILVQSNIISNSFVNGSNQPIIYAFFPNVAPGFKIVEKPQNLLYLPLINNNISIMETWLTDQNGDPIDLRGETLTIRLHIRER